GRASPHELGQLLLHRLVDRRPLVLLEQLLPAPRRARLVVERSVPRPPVDVLSRGNGRSPEALAKALERVLRAEEVPAVAYLDVRVEREARLVHLDRRELRPQQVDQLAVGDELLEARDQAALQPPRRLPADVCTGEERGLQGVEALVPRLEVDRLAGGERAAARPPRQPEPASDLPGGVQAEGGLRAAERRRARLH